MARKKVDCKITPDVPGTKEPSRLYMKLSSLTKNRPLANFLYASYLQPGVAEAMDAKGYVRDRLGQHKGADVYTFLGGREAKSLLSTKDQSRAYGFMDSSGNLIDFGGEEAYRKAQDFNNANRGRVASVVVHGDKFNILIDIKDSQTQSREVKVNEDLVKWDTLKEQLTARGIDVDELISIRPTLLNPGAIDDFFNSLRILQSTPADGLAVKDIELLLALNADNAIVKNAMSRGWGTRAEVAQRLYDITHDILGHTATEVSFATNVLNNAANLAPLNIKGMSNEVVGASMAFELTDTSYGIQATLKELDEKYHLESEVYVRKEKAIRTLSDAYADAAMSVERQIRRIEKEKGRTPTTEALRSLQDRLLEELHKKEYAKGLLDFMNNSLRHLYKITGNLASLNPTGTNLERAHAIADAVSQANSLRDAYYEIINAIATNDNLVNDFAVNDTDKAELRNIAKSVKEEFDRQREDVKELERSAMVALGTEFIGESNPLYAKDLVDIISMKEADASMTDYLYSVGRSSVATISVMGAVIRDAQNLRDRKAADFDLQIMRATHILRPGEDTRFMYDEKGRIVSQYDWDAYYKARAKFSGSLTLSGIEKGSSAYLAEMQMWEDQNTELVEVDHKNHRFERVPDSNYRVDDFQAGWNWRQREYYDRIMEIKGQIGTLLPNYAQHQFIPPQKRTTWDQIIKETLTGDRKFGDVLKTALDRANIFKKKEGTDKFVSNGVLIDGEETIASTSAYDNTILRQIPIFYTKKLDRGDLSHDFSSALTALMTTALNYEAMEGIRNVCELIEDYVDENAPIEQGVDGTIKSDSITRNGIAKVATMLRKKAQNDGTSSIIDSFVLKHIYGVENKSEGKWAVLCSNLIGYTSVKGLAVNVKGALTNKYVGIIQTLIEAMSGQYFTLADWFKAEAILLGEQGASTAGAVAGGMIGGLPGAAIGAAVGTAIGAVGMYGKFMDIITNNKNSLDTMISDFFDSSQDYFSSLSEKRYHSTVFGKLFGSFNPMAMYQRGEYWIHMMNVYATLMHEKVISYDPDTGKRRKISLYEAFKKSNKIDGSAQLALKDNIFRIDGVKINGLEDEYFNALRRRIRYVNQQCHGSMNKEDKGIIHQWMIGKMTMNFRQWMVEHYSRRWRQLHWDESIRDTNLSNFYHNTEVRLDGKKVKLIDALEMVDSGLGDGSFTYQIKDGATTNNGIALTDEILNDMLERYANDSGWRRGFKTDTFVIMKDFLEERREYQTKAAAYWDNLSETQKADVKRVLSESFMLLALAGASFAMGDPNDHRGEFFYRLWMYVVKRCLFDEKATTILGGISEAKTLINNPIASAQTMAGLLYPIYGFMSGDFFEEVQSGRFQGWNKGVRNTLKYTVPFWGQIDQLLNIGEETGAFMVFDNQITR